MGCGTSNFDCETIKSEKKKMYFNINDNNKKKNRQENKVEKIQEERKSE